LTDVSPSTGCAGKRVTIKGKNFGHSQSEVGGRVVIANVEVENYLFWRRHEIVVLVPEDAQIGTSQDVYVVNDKDFDKGTIDIEAAPC
jgi:hypothetical protein